MKNKTYGIISAVFCAIVLFSVFGKIIVIVGIILAVIFLAIALLSSDKSNRTRNNTNTVRTNNASGGLNYKPLTKKEISSSDKYQSPKPEHKPISRGVINFTRQTFDNEVIQQTSSKYIAFDVETTGLRPYEDRIIEVGAVLFENGEPTKHYGSLINIDRPIPYSATAVNHITNEMINRAPYEEVVYSELVSFLGDALQGQTILCAHNANFDMKFLSETLMRLGYNGEISYIDTLSISRYTLPDLENHKQPTVANYFGIVNANAHRAVSDAEVCGKILSCFIKLHFKEIEEKEKQRAEQLRIKEEEKRLRQEAIQEERRLRQEAVQKAKEERERLREEEKQKRILQKQAEANIPKKPIGRSVIQMDDDLNIIKKYDTVADASREVGINEKSIREVAKGRQKHAGGFIWKYADEIPAIDQE